MIYVISDLHGWPLDKVKGLFKKAGFNDSDYCFVLGDVIDRGEHGVELLQWLMVQPNIQLILGNHEIMMLACKSLMKEITDDSIDGISGEDIENYELWCINGGDTTVKGLRKLSGEQRDDIICFLEDCPFYDEIEVKGKKYLLCHSGLGNYEPGKPIWQYSVHDLVWNRPDLYDRYDPDFKVVFGHTPTHFLDRNMRGKIINTETWIDIDTGAACDLEPTLLRLDDMKTFQ